MAYVNNVSYSNSTTPWLYASISEVHTNMLSLTNWNTGTLKLKLN